MKKATGDGMFRRYDLRERQENRTSDDAPALSQLAQTQIGRRLGSTLWAPDETMPDAFADVLQKLKRNLS